MIKAAIEKILELKMPPIVKIGEREYSTFHLEAIENPLLKPFNITSLQGLVDYINLNRDGLKLDEWMIFVVDPREIYFCSIATELWRKREAAIKCELPETYGRFAFGHERDSEKFIIEVMTNFVDSTIRENLLKLAGNITSGNVTTSDDDGITQGVTVKSGVALKQATEIKNPFLLRPYRTFIEVEQPQSPFIFRLHNNGDRKPDLALYESDGGIWELEAAANIKKYLKDNIDNKAVAIIG